LACSVQVYLHLPELRSQCPGLRFVSELAACELSPNEVASYWDRLVDQYVVLDEKALAALRRHFVSPTKIHVLPAARKSRQRSLTAVSRS
jgi:hypothetical protein